MLYMIWSYQDGRIDYNEFVAMMQGPTNAGAMKNIETSFSIKFKDALKLWTSIKTKFSVLFSCWKNYLGLNSEFIHMFFLLNICIRVCNHFGLDVCNFEFYAILCKCLICN